MNTPDASGNAPLICRQCGYKLTSRDAPCPWCEQSDRPAEIRQCRQCQAELTLNDAFCGRCGATAQPGVPSPPPGSPPPPPGLQPCPSCGKQVSTLAATCPQCGHPFQPPVTSRVLLPPVSDRPPLQNDAYWQQREAGSRWFIGALVLALLATMPSNIAIFLGAGSVYCAHRLRQAGSDAAGVALMILGIGCMFVGFVGHLRFFVR